MHQYCQPPPSAWVLTWDWGTCADIWRGAAHQRGQLFEDGPLTCPTYLPREGASTGTTQPPFSGEPGALPQLPASRTSSAGGEGLNGDRPRGCMEGAVALLESPMCRRRNLHSKQEAPELRTSRGKWKLAAGLAGLFQEPILVSQPLSRAFGWICRRRPQGPHTSPHPVLRLSRGA